MKFYIGLGGIGCHTLYHFYEKCDDASNKNFFYVNTELLIENSANVYIIPNVSKGTSMLRCIGRNLVNYELYTGAMNTFFAEIRDAEEIELIFVLSSFGGFGGAALAPIMDYIEALSWGKLKSCKVVAFNEYAYNELGIPNYLFQKFETNTIDLVSELSAREQSYAASRQFKEKIFNPGCSSFLINTKNIQLDEFWKYIDFSVDELQKLDCKDKYVLSTTQKKTDVFISYSSKDQDVADLIVDSLEAYGFNSWIATRDIKEGSYAKQIMQGIREANVFLVLISKNSIESEQVKNEIDRAFNRIKDGMKIIPFILDNSELDDECQYYLCRQEMFFGKMPPISERVKELVSKIYDIVKNQ